MAIPNTLVAARPGDHILVTMPHYWGRGETVAEAKAKLKAAGGRPARWWRVHSVHPETYVNELGGINHPTGHEPVTLAESNPSN